LLRRLRAAQRREREATVVPDGVTHRFDAESSAGTVRKTKHRRVVTLEMSQFEALEVVRTHAQADADGGSSLAKLVPKGATYGYPSSSRGSVTTDQTSHAATTRKSPERYSRLTSHTIDGGSRRSGTRLPPRVHRNREKCDFSL
jgi:hypothetical protein